MNRKCILKLLKITIIVHLRKKNMHAVKQTSERTDRWHKHHLLSAVWQFLQL